MSHYPVAGELGSALRTRKVSSVELVEDAIRRIEAADETINAVVVRDFETARTAPMTMGAPDGNCRQRVAGRYPGRRADLMRRLRAHLEAMAARYEPPDGN